MRLLNAQLSFRSAIFGFRLFFLLLCVYFGLKEAKYLFLVPLMLCEACVPLDDISSRWALHRQSIERVHCLDSRWSFNI